MGFIFNKKFVLILTFFLILAESFYNKIQLIRDLFWSDILMHFLGGVLAATILVIFLTEKRNLFSFKENKFPSLIFIISFAVLIGVFWEFYEYLIEYYFSWNRFPVFNMSLDDTLSDLFFDLLGGLAAGAIYLNRFYRDNRF